MIKTIAKLALVGWLAGVIAGAPASVQAQNKPAGEKKEPSKSEKRQGVIPFTGKLTAVDKTAKTIKVGERTFQITSETKIIKAGKPATLEDAVVGDAVGGAFRKTDDGKMAAISVRLGAKPEGEAGPRKKKEAPSK
ncbi:MAG: hypothetical protein HY298_26250 [Verrucomicrobia bacterium]|nr:hypothetical protein [Verrucomicrobiota bacterium]